jgi:putative transposase
MSSHRLRQEFPGLRRHYWQAKRLWSGSYFAGSSAEPPSPSCATTLSSRNLPPRPAHTRPPSPPARRPAH